MPPSGDGSSTAAGRPGQRSDTSIRPFLLARCNEQNAVAMMVPVGAIELPTGGFSVMR